MTQHLDGSLAGIRVIDLSRVLGGPYCTQILADHGAEVIKIEPPLGDETRTWGPPFDGDTASYFLGVNRNKLGVSLDLSKEAAREKLLGLLDTADVLIENFKPGTLERWGIGYEQFLRARFPKLVHCRVSGFGADGPLGGLPGYDAAIQAMAGIMSVNGEAGGEPTRVGIPIVDMVTGLNAALGILMALREREGSQLGQFVESTLFDCALSILHPHTPNYFYSGKPPQRSGNAHPNITPYDMFHTGSVDIFLAVGNNTQFTALCEVILTPQLAADPRFESNKARTANRKDLRRALESVFEQWDGAKLADTLIRRGVPCAPVLSIDAALDLPHTAHRGMVVQMEGYKGIASPIKLSRTPATYRTPPPRLNEHEAQVFDATPKGGA
ncbi:MAG: CoA transferase [Pseudomonadota bacterium]|uniref:CaiB/BaiF CoA transferase family protein n=1 Tax=Burkholderiaceae TaxID=119060 RepID=UPI0007826AB6|nr:MULTISPECIES: CoA transferase [Burkholderiaceae]AMM17078.1 carnitine dehydratase [Burkholderia sp. PAMC 28687]MDP9156306.1 CoA transferase [Pseudomonadota bacterium]